MESWTTKGQNVRMLELSRKGLRNGDIVLLSSLGNMG